ncbi:MAG: hypothetical protein IT207_10345 [Fimbriimonadaceae bacterium]|nr:hypothetical protein [Fimbriimonadaceae bacterium]
MIVWATLKVGPSLGLLTTIKQYQHVPGEPALVTLSLLGFFDSTFFTDYTLVKVRIEAEDTFGNYLHKEEERQVDNKLFAFNDGRITALPGGNGAAEVEAAMAGSTYSSDKDQSFFWNHVTVFQELEYAGIYHVTAHGVGGTIHEAPAFDSGTNSQDYVAAGGQSQSYENFRYFWNGGVLGFPPFNLGRPPIHFAMADFCESGVGCFEFPGQPGHGPFETMLVPYYWNDEYMRNQAVWTWNGFTSVGLTQNAAWHVWTRLAAGKTVNKTRTELIQAQANGHPRVVNISAVAGPPWRRVLYSQDCPILGDKHTRIRSVYTGNDLSVSTGWYR